MGDSADYLQFFLAVKAAEAAYAHINRMAKNIRPISCDALARVIFVCGAMCRQSWGGFRAAAVNKRIGEKGLSL